ncbi:MFS transporter [Kitasatospora sp. NPDC052896]|uniref:MFS transporter n=1 Tax=Kitasatospora sp. NPDC052896 TaxID=3364061 RepID=UPI0037CB9D32
MITTSQVRRWRGPTAVALGILMVGLDNYVVVTTLPTIRAQLRTGIAQSQWVMTAYLLGWVCALLPAGRLGGRFGRRRFLLAGLAVFGVASATASQCTSAGALIATRAAMGLGAALIMALTLPVMADAFPGDRRSPATAVTTAAVMLGMPLGPLVTGLLLTRFSWGSVFLLNLPIVALAISGIACSVPESRDPYALPMDWPGLLLSGTGVTALAYGIISGPADGWSAPHVRAALAAGVVLLAAFARHELTTAAPLLELRVLADRQVAPAVAASAVASLTTSGTLFALTPFLQTVRHGSALATGVDLLPLAVGVTAGGAVSDLLADRWGGRTTLCSGLLLAAGGEAALIRLTPGSGCPVILAALALFGTGLGITSTAASDAVLDALPRARLRAGGGLSRFLQSLGTALGPALLGTVLNTAYRNRASDSATASPATLVPAAYGTGIHWAMSVGTGLLLLTALAVLIFIRIRVDEL